MTTLKTIVFLACERELTLLAESLTHFINSPEISMYRQQDHKDFKQLRDRVDTARWCLRQGDTE